MSTNSQCPPIGNAINENVNGTGSRVGLGLGLSFALVDIGVNGSWWTLSWLCALCALCVRFKLRELRGLRVKTCLKQSDAKLGKFSVAILDKFR